MATSVDGSLLLRAITRKEGTNTSPSLPYSHSPTLPRCNNKTSRGSFGIHGPKVHSLPSRPSLSVTLRVHRLCYKRRPFCPTLMPGNNDIPSLPRPLCTLVSLSKTSAVTTQNRSSRLFPSFSSPYTHPRRIQHSSPSSFSYRRVRSFRYDIKPNTLLIRSFLNQAHHPHSHSHTSTLTPTLPLPSTFTSTLQSPSWLRDSIAGNTIAVVFPP